MAPRNPFKPPRHKVNPQAPKITSAQSRLDTERRLHRASQSPDLPPAGLELDHLTGDGYVTPSQVVSPFSPRAGESAPAEQL